jgi:hypothetical protein
MAWANGVSFLKGMHLLPNVLTIVSRGGVIEKGQFVGKH